MANGQKVLRDIRQIVSFSSGLTFFNSPGTDILKGVGISVIRSTYSQGRNERAKIYLFVYQNIDLIHRCTTAELSKANGGRQVSQGEADGMYYSQIFDFQENNLEPIVKTILSILKGDSNNNLTKNTAFSYTIDSMIFDYFSKEQISPTIRRNDFRAMSMIATLASKGQFGVMAEVVLSGCDEPLCPSLCFDIDFNGLLEIRDKECKTDKLRQVGCKAGPDFNECEKEINKTNYDPALFREAVGVRSIGARLTTVLSAWQIEKKPQLKKDKEIAILKFLGEDFNISELKAKGNPLIFYVSTTKNETAYGS